MPIGSAGAPAPNRRGQRNRPSTPVNPDSRDPARPPSLEDDLAAAQGELQSAIDIRMQEEIRVLTTRYSGDAAQAERVARARAERGFAASDPDFSGEIAPLQQKVTDLEEQIRKAAQRRSTQTIGGNGGETLG